MSWSTIEGNTKADSAVGFDRKVGAVSPPLAAGRGRLLVLLTPKLVAAATCLRPPRATLPFYAEIRRQLKADGKPIPANDCWIAALAKQHRLPVMSLDKHFDAVKGLRRVQW